MKIIYTAGPQSTKHVENLLAAGADGVRLTFSFGTPEIQLGRAIDVLQAAHGLGRAVEIIADVAGGGMRIGEFASERGVQSLSLKEGERVTFRVASKVDVSELCIPLPDQNALERVLQSSRIVIGDGTAAIEILPDRSGGVALFECTIEGRRGLSVQGAFEPECLTEKDRRDLVHIAQHREYTAVALSFVQSASDVSEARHILKANGDDRDIIAKIETPTGVRNIREIATVADEVMIARGDLALTANWVEMPRAAEAIADVCVELGKPFYIATQVADGLQHNATLTRAEMCDLWHWISRGAVGVLLSRETAWGPRPVDAVSAVRELREFANTVKAHG